MILLRRIIFYIFLVTYLVTCPMVILYALGYMYQAGPDPHITKTGVISLSTIPSGASVYLGRSRFTEKTPTVLIDLFPGEYVVKIFLENHLPWVRKVPVEAGKATVLENIILMPKTLDLETVKPEVFENLIEIPESPFFLLSRGEKLKDNYIFHWRSEKLRPLLPQGSSYAENKIERYFFAEKSPSIFLHIKGGNGDRFIKINLRGTQTRIRDLTDLVKSHPESVAWEAEAEKYLFYADGNNNLSRIDIASREIQPNILEQVLGFGLFDQKIYAVKSGEVIQTDYLGKEKELLLNDPELVKGLFGERKHFRIERLEDGILIFWRKDGELIANRFPYRLVEEGVIGVEPFRDEPVVLFWQKSRIGMVDFSRKSTDESDEAFEKVTKPEWLFSEGGDIRQAFWISDTDHVIFRDGNGIYLLEVFPNVSPSARFLFNVKNKSSVYFGKPRNKLYYLDAESGKLTSFHLAGKLDLISSVRVSQQRERKHL